MIVYATNTHLNTGREPRIVRIIKGNRKFRGEKTKFIKKENIQENIKLDKETSVYELVKKCEKTNYGIITDIFTYNCANKDNILIIKEDFRLQKENILNNVNTLWLMSMLAQFMKDNFIILNIQSIIDIHEVVKMTNVNNVCKDLKPIIDLLNDLVKKDSSNLEILEFEIELARLSDLHRNLSIYS